MRISMCKFKLQLMYDIAMDTEIIYAIFNYTKNI